MGLLDDYQAQKIDANEWSPTPAQSTGYAAHQYDAKDVPKVQANTWGADNANASNWNANTFNMESTDSKGRNGVVEDRLGHFLQKDSPITQLAKSKALQGMNERGLSNSNLAIGANYAAEIAAAEPIVQHDADAFNNIGKFNVDQQNKAAGDNANSNTQVSLANQSASNQAARDNAAALNSANTWNATAQDDANKLNQQYSNQSAQFEANAANQFALKNKDALDQSAKDFANSKDEASIQNAANNLKAVLSDAQQEMSTYGTDMQRKTALDNIARQLVDTGVNAGIFATQQGAANWLGMIGELYPEMGLSVTTELAGQAAGGVI